MMRAALVLLLLAGPALAETITFAHGALQAGARRGVPDVSLVYPGDCVAFRGRVKWGLFWIPVRVEAVFSRANGRVRLRCREVYVRGRAMPARRAQADEKLAKLVDSESAADRVEIIDGETVLYSQGLP